MLGRAPLLGSALPLVLTLALFAMPSCGGGGGTGGPVGDGIGAGGGPDIVEPGGGGRTDPADVGGGTKDGGGGGGDPSDAPGGLDDLGPPPADTLGADVGPPDPVCGAFGEPCQSEGECCSGWCIPATDGYECTSTCTTSCPDGYECQFLQDLSADPVSLCVDVAAHLCQPCQSDDDCNDGDPQAPDACLDYGAEGSFCGLNCGPAGHSCPEGYACEEIPGLPGTFAQQCVRAAAGGICECSAVSEDLGLATDCLVVGDAGACPGVRACGPEGLGPCEGPEAQPETCNGADDDCDGQTDEGVPSDACTIESAWGECSGQSACAAGEGYCDAPIPAAEACDGADDDCDGETDEDTEAECSPGLCAAGACDAVCADHAGCAADAFCDLADVDGDGDPAECLSKRSDGQKCGDASGVECASGTCANGHCCGDPEGDCCAQDAHCAHLDAPPSCDDPAACAGHRVDGQCGEDHVCAAAQIPEPSGCQGAVCVEPSCDDAGAAWTSPTTCGAAGACAGGGAADDCDDGNVCTADTCVAETGCAHQAIAGLSAEPCYTHPPETLGVGICEGGVIGCDAGTSIGCVEQVGPKAEGCNGVDDDCDGETDEGGDALCEPYVCLGEAGCLSDCDLPSECIDGFFCDLEDLDADGDLHECVPAVAAGEPCHDGNDFECAAGLFCRNGFCCGSAAGDCCGDALDCQHLAAAPSCDSSGPPGCAGHRVDATCDGDSVCQVETVVDPSGCDGVMCVPGSCAGLDHTASLHCDAAGACAAGGGAAACDDSNVCTADQCSPAAGCAHEALEGATEVACYSFAPATTGVGTCSEGVVACAAGVAVSCAGEVGPADETCNGADDDCDGATDEGGDALCAPFVCAGEAGCLDGCAAQEDCAPGFYCDVDDLDGDGDSAECLAEGGSGATCHDGNGFECASGWCGNGYCCGADGADCCASILDCQHLAVPPTCALAVAGGCFGERVDAFCAPDHVCAVAAVDDPSACLDTACTEGQCALLFHTAPKRCDSSGQCTLGGGSEDCDDDNPCTADGCATDDGCSHLALDGESATECYTYEPAWTAGLGECHVGHLGCSQGTPIGCVDQAGPGLESCNGLDDDCDGATDETGDAACAPYWCGGESGCLALCAGPSDCQPGSFCDTTDLDQDGDSAECLPLLPAGQPCGDPGQCADGFCSNGFCCGSAAGPCCGSNASCQGLAEPPSCDSGAACDGHRVDAFCNVEKVCQAQWVEDASACAGTQCVAPSCNGMTADHGAACDGSGSCSTDLGSMDCQGANTCCSYSCGGGACQGDFNGGNVLCAVGCSLGIVSCDCY